MPKRLIYVYTKKCGRYVLTLRLIDSTKSWYNLKFKMKSFHDIHYMTEHTPLINSKSGSWYRASKRIRYPLLSFETDNY